MMFHQTYNFVPPSAYVLTLVVLRGAGAMDIKEREETRYAVLTQELI